MGEGSGNPLQYPCLENSTDRGAWRATVHGSQRVRHDKVTNATRWYGTEGKSINLLLEDLNFFKKLYPHFPVAMV